jgi:hypothetical protein
MLMPLVIPDESRKVDEPMHPARGDIDRHKLFVHTQPHETGVSVRRYFWAVRHPISGRSCTPHKSRFYIAGINYKPTKTMLNIFTLIQQRMCPRKVVADIKVPTKKTLFP